MHYESLRNEERINALQKVLKLRVGGLCPVAHGLQGQGVVWELQVHGKAVLHVFAGLQMATYRHGTQRSVNTALRETALRLKSWSWSSKPPKLYPDFMFIIWCSLLFRTLIYWFIVRMLFIQNRFQVLPKRQGITHNDDFFPEVHILFI